MHPTAIPGPPAVQAFRASGGPAGPPTRGPRRAIERFAGVEPILELPHLAPVDREEVAAAVRHFDHHGHLAPLLRLRREVPGQGDPPGQRGSRGSRGSGGGGGGGGAGGPRSRPRRRPGPPPTAPRPPPPRSSRT